ncbi:MAG: hypothetical protein U0903_05880 [Planctomycetales bacterium]
MWLQEKKADQWWEVPGYRQEYADYNQFLQAYNSLAADVTRWNQNGSVYAVNWKMENGSADDDPDLPIPSEVPDVPPLPSREELFKAPPEALDS